jgi:hypothetical protein
MRGPGKYALLLAMVVYACGKRAEPVKAGPPQAEPPKWVTHVELERSKLCGLGVAGAGYDDRSPYPKQLSQERAVRNLAGILGTSVQEAIVDKSNSKGTQVELARALHVDDTLIEKVKQLAESDYWLDHEGVGPFAQKNFTYAHTCIDAAKAAATFKVDPKTLIAGLRKPVTPQKKPRWLKVAGKQADGRICAVGFSLPMFFADKTFEGVVEDVRGQLAEVIETLVSSYYEELTNDKQMAIEAMTVATTQALSKGVIVTDFWYDRDGIGPNRRARSTYGLGCVYPMDIIETSLAAVEEKLPDEKDKIARVRENAERAFDALDAEIDKRDGQASANVTPAPAPTPTPSDAPSADIAPAAATP